MLFRNVKTGNLISVANKDAIVTCRKSENYVEISAKETKKAKTAGAVESKQSK